MTRQAARLCWLFLAFALSLSTGCAGAASPDLGPLPDAGANLVAEGRALVDQYGCANCHDPGDGSFSGSAMPVAGTSAYAPNLSSDDDTGLGSWSDDEIARAIRDGVDDQESELCPTMPRFSQIGDAQMTALVAFLRSLPAVSNQVPDSICPPLKTGDSDDDAGAGGDGGVVAGDMTAIETGDLNPNPDLNQVTQPEDMAGGQVDMKGVLPAACRAVINEFQTGAQAAPENEFVEVFNPGATALDLSGVALVYRAAAGVADHVLVHLSGTLAAGGYFVCGGPRYGGAAGATYHAISFAAVGGGIALVDNGGATIDMVGYGNAKNAFVQGSAAPAPPVGQSASRLPNGVDSGDNGKDFVVTAHPTPGAANQ